FAKKLLESQPALAPQLLATGATQSTTISVHIQAADLMLQPYKDGVTFRNTTCMATLEHGRPVVTTTGRLSEPLWSSADALRCLPDHDVAGVVAAVNELMVNASRRGDMWAAAQRLYAS